VRLQERADRAHTNRGFTLLRNPDGSGWFLTDAELDDECGQLLWTVLQAQMATDPDNPTDNDPPPTAGTTNPLNSSTMAPAHAA